MKNQTQAHFEGECSRPPPSAVPRSAFRVPRSSEFASTLVIALMTVSVLSLVAANVLLSISSRYNSAYRSASWNEALLTAQAGVDVVVAEFLRAVPDVRASTNGLGVGYSQPSTQLVTGLQISPTGVLTSDSLPTGTTTIGTLASVTIQTPTHGGEGSTAGQAQVSVQVVALSTLLGGGVTGALNTVTGILGGNDLQLLCLRSTGTVYLTGGTLAGMSRQDNDLWRPSLMNDRLTGASLTAPTVARQVEAYLRPVYAFEAGVVSNDALLATDPGTVFDSFNSSMSGTSTGGLYDSAKRESHATVRANGSNVALGGKVWGNVDTNGGSVAQDTHVSGAVNNASYDPVPLVKVPTWPGIPLLPASVTGSLSLGAGTSLLPAQYKFSGVSGNLHITRGLGNAGTNVEIFINGDLTGGIEIDNGVTAKVYVSGSINTNASQLKNDAGLASALQIYGVPPDGGSAPSIRLNLDTDLAAAIYAPGHQVYLNGNNDLSGAIVAGRLETSGPVRVHYDEALGYTTGPLLRYELASWKEIVN